MKERPILFKGDMIRAILKGRKTETRRQIKPQPDYSILKFGTDLEAHRCPQLGPVHLGRKQWGLYGKPYHSSSVPCFAYNCPYGQVGDRLWVRETWQNTLNNTGDEIITLYAADYSIEDYEHLKPWKPSIYLAKRESRITLEIADIRVEQVQDITEEGAKAESVIVPEALNILADFYKDHSTKHRIIFQELWNSINVKPGYSWDANPWVWVIKFKRIME